MVHPGCRGALGGLGCRGRLGCCGAPWVPWRRLGCRGGALGAVAVLWQSLWQYFFLCGSTFSSVAVLCQSLWQYFFLPGAPPTPLKCRTCAQLYSRPSNSLSNLRCRASHLSSAAPPWRPWQANFSERAKKSARLCGEMRVHFCLPKLCCLTKRKGRAHKNPPNRFLEARGPTLNAQLPADGRDARERRRPLVVPVGWRIFSETLFQGSGAVPDRLRPTRRRDAWRRKNQQGLPWARHGKGVPSYGKPGFVNKTERINLAYPHIYIYI